MADAGCDGAIDGYVELSATLASRGDHRNALRVLVAVSEALAEASVPTPVHVESEQRGRPLDALCRRMARHLAEAGLAGMIPSDEREELAARLVSTLDAVDARPGAINAFAAARRAVLAGWSDPEVSGVMDGSVSAWAEPEVAEAEKALLSLRLARLADRPSEAARLEAAARTSLDIAIDLVAKRLPAEAVALASATFTRAWQARRLCASLDRAGYSHEFLEVAAIGLGLPASPGWGPGLEDGSLTLGRFVRDAPYRSRSRAAYVQGIRLRAARIAFAAACTEDDYLALKEVAGPVWASIRGEILAEAMAAPASGNLAGILMADDEDRLARIHPGMGSLLPERDLHPSASRHRSEDAAGVAEACRTSTQITDERGPPFITEAREAIGKLGFDADLSNAPADFANFQFRSKSSTPGHEYRILVSVGLSDGKVMPPVVTERRIDGPNTDEPDVDYANLPISVCRQVERLYSTLSEVAERHYDSTPAISFG